MAVRLLTRLVLAALTVAATLAPALPAAAAGPVPWSGNGQLITVNTAQAGSSYATLSAWQRGAGGTWVRVLGPVPARVGGSGVGVASEGSDTTPAGTFPLTQAFGRMPDPGTRMPYFVSDPLDWWDENPSSPTYNLHVRQADSPGGASENLYYSGSVYDYAVNISYNLARVPGAGSAIFLHVGDGGATAGCVSIAEPTLVAILRWLDPAQHPAIDIRVGAAVTPGPVLTPQAAGRLVDALYQGILGRTADPGGAAAYTGALLAGAGAGSAAQALVSSGEYARRLVGQAYRDCLGRDPDPGGQAYFVAALRSWWWGAVESRLCSSGEAWNRAGAAATPWITAVYRGLLGRAPDPAGLGVWTGVLSRQGRQAVTDGITRSAEFGHHQLDLVYRQLLGRPADPSGVAVRAASMSVRGVFTVPVALAGSGEFFARAQA